MNDLDGLPDVGELGVWVSNQQAVENLQHAIVSAPRDLRMVRQGLANILRTDPPAFTRRFDPHRGRVWKQEAHEFIKFITDPLPDGLGTDAQTMRLLLRDCPEELALFDLAVSRGRGGNNNPEGIGGRTGKVANPDIVRVDNGDDSKGPPAGNSAEYAHRRLSRERPDLFDRVRKGELTPHGAMVEAGFRKKPTPLEMVKRLLPKLGRDELAEVVRLCVAQSNNE